MKKASFTKEELKLWESLGEWVAGFQRLEQTHPSDIPEMVRGIHSLQHILGQRVLRREFPGSFATYKVSTKGQGNVQSDD